MAKTEFHATLGIGRVAAIRHGLRALPSQMKIRLEIPSAPSCDWRMEPVADMNGVVDPNWAVIVTTLPEIYRAEIWLSKL